MYEKILVTGGTGLLGHAIMAAADAHPESRFVSFGSKDCDLTNLEETVEFVAGQRPDAIIHAAALAGGVQYSTSRPATLLRDNVLMSFSVLEAARRCGVKKTIMTLSTGMYAADTPLPIKEEYIHDGYPHESNYSYAFAKRLIDPSIKAYRTEYGINVIGLVVNGLFGENANFRLGEAVMVPALVRRFFEQRDSGAPIVIWGDGSPLREYSYGGDMARAFLWCLENYDDSRILHVGSTEEHSVREIALMIAETVGVDPERLVFDASKPAGIFRKSTDNSRFVGLSGFRYTPFKEGLRRTVAWFQQNHHRPGCVRL